MNTTALLALLLYVLNSASTHMEDAYEKRDTVKIMGWIGVVLWSLAAIASVLIRM